MTQDTAYKIITKTEDNIFLTGQPGAGKTHLTNKVIEWAILNGKRIEVCASTGIAATHISGRTFHSFVGVRNDDKLKEDDIQQIINAPWTKGNYKADIVFIDEVSMLSASLLDTFDMLAKRVRGNSKPFGGIRVIVIGDFYQLPPVEGEFAFKSMAWQKANFKTCYLTEQHRSKDLVFNSILTGIRRGHLEEEQKDIIRGRMVNDVADLGNTIRIDTHNKNVDEINDRMLTMKQAEPKTYVMTGTGDKQQDIDQLKRTCLSPERLTLKVGVRVMFTKNDKDKRWVNGTQGEIVEMRDDSVVVKTIANGTHEVEFAAWEKSNGYGNHKKVIATIHQIPLRLAYAITTHKSQGCTFDRAVIDVTKVFAPGQAYVAISRVRSLEGVYLQGRLTKNFLQIDDDVVNFDKFLVSDSKELEKQYDDNTTTDPDAF